MSITSENETLNFTKGDIERADARNDEQTNAPFVTFRLTRQGSIKFGQFTTRHVNKQVNLSVCGETISSPVIREPIFSGAGILGNVLTNAKAAEIAEALNSGTCG